MTAVTESKPVKVLLVCTGNICRSPLAEQLLRQSAEEVGISREVEFDSAGTFAEVGRSTHRETLASAERRGRPIEPLVSKQVTKELVVASDLILTATAEHRSNIVQIVPGANRKTYTIKEFERLLRIFSDKQSNIDEQVQQEFWSAKTLPELFGMVAKFRGFAPRLGENDDILDPYGTNAEFFDVVTDELVFLADSLASHFKVIERGEGDHG